jgi:hypothetical protein
LEQLSLSSGLQGVNIPLFLFPSQKERRPARLGALSASLFLLPVFQGGEDHNSRAEVHLLDKSPGLSEQEHLYFIV